jgi:integrase/recombinase XerD
MSLNRTPAKKKAKELSKYLRSERPDYDYLKKVFQHLREELEVEIPKKIRKTSLCSNRRGIKTLL